MVENVQEPGSAGDPDNSNAPAPEADSPESATNAATAPQAGWGNLSADEEKLVKNKGWKAPLDALKSYQELEKSAHERVALPKAGDEEALRKLDRQLGCPETIEGYELTVAENDKPFIDDFKTAALNAGLRPGQVGKLYEWYQSQNDKAAEAFNAQVEKDKEEVKAEWGNDYPKNEELMKRGFRMLGLSTDELQNIECSIGTKAFMRLGKKLGDSISEDNTKGLGGGVTKTEEMSTEDFFKEVFAQANNEGK